jgi:hypothetical protein
MKLPKPLLKTRQSIRTTLRASDRPAPSRFYIYRPLHYPFLLPCGPRPVLSNLKTLLRVIFGAIVRHVG